MEGWCFCQFFQIYVQSVRPRRKRCNKSQVNSVDLKFDFLPPKQQHAKKKFSHSVTWFHKNATFRKIFSFINHEKWHKVFGWCIISMGIVHTIAWNFSAYLLTDKSRWSDEDYQEIPSFALFMFTTIPGLTGQ